MVHRVPNSCRPSDAIETPLRNPSILLLERRVVRGPCRLAPESHAHRHRLQRPRTGPSHLPTGVARALRTRGAEPVLFTAAPHSVFPPAPDPSLCPLDRRCRNRADRQRDRRHLAPRGLAGAMRHGCRCTCGATGRRAGLPRMPTPTNRPRSRPAARLPAVARGTYLALDLRAHPAARLGRASGRVAASTRRPGWPRMPGFAAETRFDS